jgi:hypothetical protein
MLIFLLVPIQENTEYEIPPSYCLGTIPSNCSYNSEDIQSWTKLIFLYAKQNDIKLLGAASDNFSPHQTVWREWMFSSNKKLSFLPASYAKFSDTKCVPFEDMPHLLRNWLYNLQNLGKVMQIGNWPILYENLQQLNNYMVVPQNYLNVNKKMNQKAAEFFFSKPIIDMLKTRFDGIACGLQLYLIYGTKLWRVFMDREIPMEERLFLAGEIMSFLLLWWNSVEKKEQDLLITRNTMMASLQACLSLYVLNQIFEGEEIPACPWRLGSQP